MVPVVYHGTCMAGLRCMCKLRSSPEPGPEPRAPSPRALAPSVPSPPRCSAEKGLGWGTRAPGRTTCKSRGTGSWGLAQAGRVQGSRPSLPSGRKKPWQPWPGPALPGGRAASCVDLPTIYIVPFFQQKSQQANRCDTTHHFVRHHPSCQFPPPPPSSLPFPLSTCVQGIWSAEAPEKNRQKGPPLGDVGLG